MEATFYKVVNGLFNQTTFLSALAIATFYIANKAQVAINDGVLVIGQGLVS